MKASTTFLGIACVAALGVPTWAQERENERTEQPKAQRAKEQDSNQTKQSRALINELGDSKYTVRQKAEEKLKEKGEEALKDLKDAAKNHEDAEVRWRAGRLVRQIEGKNEDGLRVRGQRSDQDQSGVTPAPAPQWQYQFGPGQQGRDRDLNQMFEQLFQQMERNFGVDIPQQRFFQDDFFRDLQSQLRGKGLGGLDDFQGEGQAMSMRIDQDGVKVTIKEKDEKGEVKSKVYEAPDLDSFRQQYPEVAERLHIGKGGVLRGGGMWSVPPMPGIDVTPWRVGRARQLPGFGVGQGVAPTQSDVPEGERLGVMVRADLSQDTRDVLGLEEGEGLLVEEVVEGSLAERLGVQKRDVVVKIGGVSVGSVEDVQRALRKVGVGEGVEVVVNRKGSEKVLSAKKGVR